MKKENEEKLFAKYQEIFSDRTLPKEQSLMCYGFCCGDGWYNLIDDMCQEIEDYCDKNNLNRPKAAQVKEKFGGLRFYIYGGDDEIYNIISKAEKKSYSTCSGCGIGINIEEKDRNYFLKTLCEECKEKKCR